MWVIEVRNSAQGLDWVWGRGGAGRTRKGGREGGKKWRRGRNTEIKINAEQSE